LGQKYSEGDYEEASRAADRTKSNLVGPLTDDAIAKQREVQLQIEALLEQEELYWVQHGRVNWLKYGDQNTDFFRRSASTRRKINFIRQLKNDVGDIVEDQGQLLDLSGCRLFSATFYCGSAGPKSRAD
jgi:hypothetical protein